MNLEAQPRPAATISLVAGISIVVLGCLFFLSNLGWISGHIIWKLSPLILVAIGGAKIRQRKGEVTVGPVLLVVVGLVLVLRNFGLGSLDDMIPSLILVALGIFIITHSLKRQRQVPQHLTASQDFVQGTAIFGGVKRRVSTLNLQGGELTAIFGGFECDLREARLEGQARLDIFVLFGGGELLVPEGWDVVVRATSLFGAVDDKTRPAAAQEGVTRPTLVITGLTLFGGIDIKHS